MSVAPPGWFWALFPAIRVRDVRDVIEVAKTNAAGDLQRLAYCLQPDGRLPLFSYFFSLIFSYLPPIFSHFHSTEDF